MQPDEGLLTSGSFQTLLGQTTLGLTRLNDDYVLAVSAAQAAANTTAWPVPAHGALHLALDAARHPQQVQLLDALGRVVLVQPAAGAARRLPAARRLRRGWPRDAPRGAGIVVRHTELPPFRV